MGTFYGDFQIQLQQWEQRYAGRPHDELLELAFLSLEREQLVSVTYHDDLLMQRMNTMPMEPAARELIRHALAFTWKDEEMHAVYVRGLLWREGRFRVRLRSNWHYVAGLIAGWATFVQQHVRWSEAPLSRLMSTTALWGGFITGTAPPSVRQHLRYHSFRDFCAFNVDAEKTAGLAWHRLAAVGRAAGLDPEIISVFEKIRDDEALHERLFATLAEVLDDQDALTVDAQTLADRFAAIHEDFVPSRKSPHPLGRGGTVAVVEGASSRAEALDQALERGMLMTTLQERAVALGKPMAELRVAVKTSFMLGLHRGDPSTVISPEAVAALVSALQQHGISDIAVLEAPSLYERFFSGRSVAEVGAYFGFAGAYRLVDASADQVEVHFPRGMVPATVSSSWRDADVRIVLGKPRSHPVQLVMLGLAALDGLGQRTDAFHFPERAVAPEVVMVSLASVMPPHFSLLDGWDAAPDGLAGMLGAREPRSPRRVWAGADALAVDLVAARHLGLADPFTSTTLRTAMHWLGDPRPRTEVQGPDTALPDWRLPYRHGLARALQFFASFVYAHASGRGTLFVPSADERAFPSLSQPGLLVRAGRRGMRWFFGLPTLESTP